MSDIKEKLIIALDYSSPKDAYNFQEQFVYNKSLHFYKIGLELFSALAIDGPFGSVFDEFVFLDLKISNDIPVTIEKTVAKLTQANITFLSFSDCTTEETIKAAVKGRGKSQYPKLLMVVDLSSSNVKDYCKRNNLLNDYFSTHNHKMNLLEMAVKAGIDGFIASGNDINFIKTRYPDKIVVTPGIRPNGFDKDDHKKCLTPFEAIQNGSDYIVVGRPITQSKEPEKVIELIKNEIKEALEKENPRN